MPSQDELAIIACATVIIAACALKKKRAKEKRKRCWVKSWPLKRDLKWMSNMSLATEECRNFLGMDDETFALLLMKVEDKIKKQDTLLRESISAKQRLCLTLRFLTTGESYATLMNATCVPKSTLSIMIPEVCEGIYESLKEEYLQTPDTPEKWQAISQTFLENWNFPNCIGAMGGKHITFCSSKKYGSPFLNCKGSRSIVMIALVDAMYRFRYVDVGTNGRISEKTVFRDSSVNLKLVNGHFNIPDDTELPGSDVKFPYVFIAEDVFPLQSNILKPYAQQELSEEQRIYNYRISRAKEVAENAFGVLCNKFRVLSTTINLSPAKIEKIVLAACALHNFLIANSNCVYLTATDVDSEDIKTGLITPGSWREFSKLSSVKAQIGRQVSTDAILQRDLLCKYFSGVGKVSWQDRVISNSS